MDHQESSLNPNQLNALLKLTSQRLGTTPEALKQAAQNGSLNQLISGMQPEQSAAMQQVLSDPEAAKKLLSTPQAQKLLQMLRKDRP